MQLNQTHKFTLQGITGIVVGLVLIIFLLIIHFLTFNFSSYKEIYQIPNLYYKVFIGFVCLIGCVVIYYTIWYINTSRSNKNAWQLLPINTKLIKTTFWAMLLLSVLVGIYFVLNTTVEFIIPTALLFYGIFCITINKLTNGNSIILGLFFVLQSFLAILFPEAAYILAIIAFGIFHIIYAFLGRRQHYTPST